MTPFQCSVGGALHVTLIVVGPRDSTVISLGGAEGSSSPVMKVTESAVSPRPTSFSPLISIKKFFE
jgi:hypothetical protein